MTNHTQEQTVPVLRHVIVGVGAGIFSYHRLALDAAEAVAIVGVSDVNTEIGQQRAAELGCPFFADHRALLAATHPDVAVIITPHPFHAAIAIDCLDAGCHVLVEKPMAVQVAEADAMVDAAARAGKWLAVNFQMRHRPEVIAAKRLLRDGALGQVQRVQMVATWLRSKAYYASGAWRATWKGEGGGVLLNQAPHNLDLICYLLDAPRRVVAWTRRTLHDLETEDTAQAMLEWDDGTLGSVYFTTAEAGVPERLEIGGTAGMLQLTPGELAVSRLATDVRELIANGPRFPKPESQPVPVPLPAGTGDHVAVYRDFHAAIRHGTLPNADGVEGRKSLELANAMIYSSCVGAPVELPLDRARYAALLADLQAQRVAIPRQRVS